MARSDYFICPVCDGKAMYDSSDYRGAYTGMHDTCLADLVNSLAAGDTAKAVAVLRAARQAHDKCDDCDGEPCDGAQALDKADTDVTAALLPQDVREFIDEIGKRHLEGCPTADEDCPYCCVYFKYVPWERQPEGRLAGA